MAFSGPVAAASTQPQPGLPSAPTRKLRKRHLHERRIRLLSLLMMLPALLAATLLILQHSWTVETKIRLVALLLLGSLIL